VLNQNLIAINKLCFPPLIFCATSFYTQFESTDISQKALIENHSQNQYETKIYVHVQQMIQYLDASKPSFLRE